MLIEELQPFLKAQPDGYTSPATFYLTMNKTQVNNTWSAAYQDHDTGVTLLPVNNCVSLDEVALRLGGRLDRYLRHHASTPRTLHSVSKHVIVSTTNITEGTFMSESENMTEAEQEATQSFGQQTVGSRKMNPAHNEAIERIKALQAEFIDIFHSIRSGTPTQTADREVARLASVAITDAENACMHGIKCLSRMV